LERHASAEPAFALGGPTITWYEAANRETAALFKAPRPNLPVKTIAGTREGVVDRKALIAMHENWPTASLEWIEGGRHELMMEAPDKRQQFLERARAFLSSDAA
ncbi:MAG: alpha/beta hydrolase, partial [Boseongicola sp.]|nr:alpha/beta hydrolase [Boseongicola sp.]